MWRGTKETQKKGAVYIRFGERREMQMMSCAKFGRALTLCDDDMLSLMSVRGTVSHWGMMMMIIMLSSISLLWAS